MTLSTMTLSVMTLPWWHLLYYTQHKDTQYKDTQYSDWMSFTLWLTGVAYQQRHDIQHNIIQHINRKMRDSLIMLKVVMLKVFSKCHYAECCLCWVSPIWLSWHCKYAIALSWNVYDTEWLCWVLLCWLSISRVSFRLSAKIKSILETDVMTSVLMLKVIQDKTLAKCSTLELTVRVPCIFIAMNQNSLT